MQCPRCQQENPPAARFCNSCGAGFELTCPSCRHSNPAGSQFCNRCGASLGATPTPAGPRFASPEAYTPKHLAERILTSRAALEGERKHVTVLFADLKGSTASAGSTGGRVIPSRPRNTSLPRGRCTARWA